MVSDREMRAMLKESYMNDDVGLAKNKNKKTFTSAIHHTYSVYTLIVLYTYSQLYIVQM